MTKRIQKILPAGLAVFPKLNEVDVYQPVDKNGRPNGAKRIRFITRIKFDDENHRKVDAFLQKCLKEAGLEGGKLPWKKDKKTGELSLEAASGEKYPPPLFDAKGNELPRSKVIIGGGSKLKLDVTVNPYTGLGGGINLYINAVQVLELQQRNANRFEEEEGFSYSGDGEEKQPDASPFGNSDDDEDF